MIIPTAVVTQNSVAIVTRLVIDCTGNYHAWHNKIFLWVIPTLNISKHFRWGEQAYIMRLVQFQFVQSAWLLIGMIYINKCPETFAEVITSHLISSQSYVYTIYANVTGSNQTVRTVCLHNMLPTQETSPNTFWLNFHSVGGRRCSIHHEKHNLAVCIIHPVHILLADHLLYFWLIPQDVTTSSIQKCVSI